MYFGKNGKTHNIPFQYASYTSEKSGKRKEFYQIAVKERIFTRVEIFSNIHKSKLCETNKNIENY